MNEDEFEEVIDIDSPFLELKKKPMDKKMHRSYSHIESERKSIRSVDARYPKNESLVFSSNHSYAMFQSLIRSSLNNTQNERGSEAESKDYKRVVDSLRNQIQANKIFLYMVIHDLKHPAESQISQLETLENQIMDHISNLDAIIQKTHKLENEIAKA